MVPGGLGSLKVFERAPRVLDAVAERDVVTVTELVRQKIVGVRSMGYALSLNEFIAETGALGAPVLGPDGDVIAGVRVGAILARFSDGRLPLITSVVIQGAYEISRLGYTRSFPPTQTQEGRDAG